MSDPNVLTIFSVVFILLGLYNVNSGIKRMREAQRRGQPVRWYKQINLLTGIEYALLSLVFLLSLNIRNGTLPRAFQSIVVPFYLVVLLSSAVLAGFVIRQAFLNLRTSRRNPAAQASGTNGKGIAGTRATMSETLTSEQQALNVQRRRERRQKAAAARRRRSGR